MNTATAPRRLFALCGIGILALLPAVPIAAQTLFTDVTEQVGLDAFLGIEARNLVFVDYDNDGFQDVFITENVFSARRTGLFHNTGNGRLVDQTFRLPADLHRGDGSAGAIFGDYDNDGDEDLFLPVWPHNVLLRNDRGLFTQVNAGSDLADSLWTDNAICLDYDRDGYLDLYVGSRHADEDYAPRANRLLRNNGDNTFTDQTAVAGLDILLNPELGGSRGGMAAGDFNDDGWPDLFIGVFSHANRLFLNDGEGGFKDATSGDIPDEGEAFTVAVGDIDRDGDLDIFQGSGSAGLTSRSQMLLNLGEGRFLDVTEAVGLGLELLGTNVDGAVFVDVDNDGDLDLIIGRATKESGDEPLLLLNDGSGIFVDQTAASGIEDVGPYAAVGDYDEDGFVDLLLSSSFTRGLTAFYSNNGNDNHWLRVELVGVESNRSGIGSRLQATSGDLTQVREILGGMGRQEDERVAHFGLGDRTRVDRLEVRWPSGQVDVLTDIPVDRKIRVFEGRERFHTVQPTRWEHNLPEEVTRRTRRDIAIAVWPTRFDPDATIARVTADLSELGGSADLPLSLDEEGVYRLDTSLEIDALRGSYTVFVDIEQQTFLGDHWIQLSKTLTVLPDEDVDLFGGAGEEDWTWYGQDLMRLTDHPESDYAPSWSPDGTKIAFQASRDGNYEVYVMDADGGNQTNLTNHDATEVYVSWAPDGTRISFRSYREGDGQLYVMDLETGNITHLTEGYTAPASAWSPDGTKIVFRSSRSGNWEIYVIDVDGGDPINMTHHPGSDNLPAWSPDGRRIAFASKRTGNWDLFVLTPGDASRVEIDPQERGTVFTGSEALAVQAGAEWWLNCQPAAPFDWTGYGALGFAFHPGELSASAGEELGVWIGGNEVDLLGKGLVDLAAAKWQVVEIPFEQFELREPIACIDFSGDFTGSFYIDDLRLVPAKPSSESTAVTEDHVAGLPSTFALEQNYPNPFNSGTVIRFALPEHQDVELSIFNLAGQQVATLVDGVRAAGVYALHWDGRDDDDRQLASGVYLYRLRVGEQQVETRKLLLLR